MDNPTNRSESPNLYYDPSTLEDGVRRYMGFPPHTADTQEFRSDVFVRAMFAVWGERAVQEAFLAHGMKIWGSSGLINAHPEQPKGIALYPKTIEIAEGVFVTPATIVKVERVLVFEGPASWVYETLKRRWLRGKHPQYSGEGGPNLGKDKIAIERSLVVSIGSVQDPTYAPAPTYPEETIGAIALRRFRAMDQALKDIAAADETSTVGGAVAIAKAALAVK